MKNNDMHDAMILKIKTLESQNEQLKSINNRLCDNLNELHKRDNDKFRDLRKLRERNEELVFGIRELLSLTEE